MRVDAGIPVPAAGAVRLATDVHLPATLPAPAVLTRTPYDRAALRAEGAGWTNLGFVFVSQDVRGRYGSAGTWTPYASERGDGAALVDWVRAQPWCDGTVVVSGASYAAFTAWAAALSRPDVVTAVVSQVPAMGTHRVAFDPSGVLRLAEHAGWWSEHAEARTSRTGLAAAVLGARTGVLARLPLSAIGDALGAPLPGWWPAVAAGPVATPEAVTDDELAGCPLPALHVGGWWDLLVPETLHQWELAGASRSPRPPRALLIGPWPHELSVPGADRVGLRRYGPAGQLPLGPLQADWIRAVAGGDPPSWTTVFLGGVDRWLSRWPPPTGERTLWADATGTLGDVPPATDGAAGFRYDPARPYPTVLPAHDRSALDRRPDAVAFRTAPLTTPVAVSGAGHVILHASSSAPSTDFVVRLSERLRDGSCVEIAAGAVDTARARAPYEVRLSPAAQLIPAGSSLELLVTSSDFPRLARNLNTGADRGTGERIAVADQTVHTGPGATRVVLPVLTGEG